MKGDVEIINQHCPEPMKFDRLHTPTRLNQRRPLQLPLLIRVVLVPSIFKVVIIIIVVAKIIITKSESRTIECSQSVPFDSGRIYKTSNCSRNILILKLTIIGFIA